MTFEQLVDMQQAERGLKLAHWLANRMWPRKPAAHGFYEPAEFFEGLFDRRHRPSFVRALEADILFMIRLRDGRMTREQLARRYRLEPFLEICK